MRPADQFKESRAQVLFCQAYRGGSVATNWIRLACAGQFRSTL